MATNSATRVLQALEHQGAESRERPVGVLTRQIDRLYDLNELRLQPAHDQNAFQERLAC